MLWRGCAEFLLDAELHSHHDGWSVDDSCICCLVHGAPRGQQMQSSGVLVGQGVAVWYVACDAQRCVGIS